MDGKGLVGPTATALHMPRDKSTPVLIFPDSA